MRPGPTAGRPDRGPARPRAGRAITNAIAIVVVGPAVLTTLRRAARRATVVGTLRRVSG